jgi:hypothetical protein
MSTHVSPFTRMFPSDVGRLIFEEAAADDKRTALQLPLVSRQVQSWSVANRIDQIRFTYSHVLFSN